jgi:hypothetical protein
MAPDRRPGAGRRKRDAGSGTPDRHQTLTEDLTIDLPCHSGVETDPKPIATGEPHQTIKTRCYSPSIPATAIILLATTLLGR